jgi:hypothetical protein
MKYLNLLTSFLPWIAFSVFSSSYPPIAIPSAIILSLLSYRKLIKGFVLDWVSLIFFIVVFIDFHFFQNVWLKHHMSIVVSFLFVAIAGFSLLIHIPFTLQYAKLEVEKDKWNTPRFFRINQLMTAGLGIIFLFMALLTIYRSDHPEFLSPGLIWGVGLSIQVLFINRFPQWYRKRYLRK